MGISYYNGWYKQPSFNPEKLDTFIISYLTNGDVEVGNLYRTKENGKEFFTDKYKYDKWLTPERYYSSDYDDEHIFLLVSQEQYLNNENQH